MLSDIYERDARKLVNDHAPLGNKWDTKLDFLMGIFKINRILELVTNEGTNPLQTN